MPVAGTGMSPELIQQLLTLKVAVGDAGAMVTTEFKQPLSILVHPAYAEVAGAGKSYLPVVPNGGFQVA